MILVGLFSLCALVMIATITVANTLTFPRLKKTILKNHPFVSLLVPARDEAGVIQATVARLLAQDYTHFELIVLDDASSDGTPQLALQAGKGDERLQVICGKTLPAGWSGKNWACQQLAEAARGEVLVFTDADVCWEPGALSAVVAGMDTYHADTFTVWPTQQAVCWAERLVVPLMMFTITSYLPEIAVRVIPWAIPLRPLTGSAGCSAARHTRCLAGTACGLPIALAGSIAFIVSGWHQPALPSASSGYLHWPAVLGIGITSVLLAPFGARLAHTLPVKTLRRTFALFLALLGLRMLLA